MNFKTKRRLKRFYILSKVLSIISTVGFLITFILTMSVLPDSNNVMKYMFYMIGIGFFLMIVLCVAIYCNSKLQDYKEKIKKFRDLRNFEWIMKFIENGEIKKAHNFFKNHSIYDEQFVYPYLLTHMLNSNDTELIDEAKSFISETKKEYSSNRIKF